MTTDWANPRLRPYKRALSVYEKQTILTTGRALIMPGDPPGEGEGGEIEELLAVGFDQSQIIGVERDPRKAERLYEHYYDAIALHCDTVETFVDRTEASYAYAHFDFCSALMPDYAAMLTTWSNHLSSVSRVRVSVQTTRRRNEQQSYEAHLHRHLVDALCHQADTKLEADTDITQVIAFLWLLNYSLGTATFDYLDDVIAGNPHLPDACGTHQMLNLRRFSYKEPFGHTVMHTVWADFVAFDPNLPLSKAWVPLQVAQLVAQLAVPCSAFTSEDLL